MGTSKDEMPESRERRMLEIGLMRHFVSKTAQETAIDDVTRPMICETVPEQAINCDSLLYALFSTAALHQVCTRCTPDESATMAVHHRYLSMALLQHQESLDNITADNLDAICLTSAMLRVCSWAMLQTRSLQPYSPPLEWLMISGTVTALHQRAWSMTKDRPDSIAFKYLTSPKTLEKTESASDSSLCDFAYLLGREEDDFDAELWDMDTSLAFVEALNLLTEARRAMDAGHKGNSCRKLIIFPMMIRKRLLSLVQESQPRALLVLAHYFALMSRFDCFWWIGQGPAQEVRAIAAKLSSVQRWKRMLEWPLERIT
jgi:hypothetical protein